MHRIMHILVGMEGFHLRAICITNQNKARPLCTWGVTILVGPEKTSSGSIPNI